MAKSKNPVKVMCRSCKKDTNHKVISRYDDVFVPEEDTYDPFELSAYMIIRCMGCDAVSFMLYNKTSSEGNIDFPDDFNKEDEEGISFLTLYPEVDVDNLNKFIENDLHRLPKQINELYEELKYAFENESRVLAGIGLRTLVEAICINQNISGSNLQMKIKKLSEEGLISTNEHPILDKLRLIGNASAHSIKSIDIEYLEYALEIVNHIIKSIYILPNIDKKLTKALMKKKK